MDAHRVRLVALQPSLATFFTITAPGSEPVRLTEDNDSKLPRYYYSQWDHYISPTWSPDGKEIILVSNRGHIHGSGGFWRMDARPGARCANCATKETTWKARPDWSPDGKRVVYSSYLGRQWNQLWADDEQWRRSFSPHLWRIRRDRAALVARRQAHRVRLQRGRQYVALGHRGAGRQEAACRRRGNGIIAGRWGRCESMSSIATDKRSVARLSVTAATAVATS